MRPGVGFRSVIIVAHAAGHSGSGWQNLVLRTHGGPPRPTPLGFGEGRRGRIVWWNRIVARRGPPRVPSAVSTAVPRRGGSHEGLGSWRGGLPTEASGEDRGSPVGGEIGTISPRR